MPQLVRDVLYFSQREQGVEMGESTSLAELPQYPSTMMMRARTSDPPLHCDSRHLVYQYKCPIGTCCVRTYQSRRPE
mgnify:CR=1 FL=1